MNALRNLGWWAADYAYAAVWQVRAFFGRTDAGSFANGDAAPIVVLPGVYETWRFLQPLVEALHDRGHPVHVLEVLAHSRRPITEMATQVTDYLQQHDLRDVILVAHSKGGLAGKQVMLGPAADRVRSMLAIATPFGGSRYARRMPVRTLRAFSPDDPSIRALSTQADVNARIVSVYARFDPHIPEGSELPGAKNVLLDTGGHFRVLAHPRVMAELAALAS
ncbi:pimeloyl-ACP methyl ester carboxylesterase [Microbacterium natoriense]|uniref:Pimeloyl-ACP methyl ester carboxylesterase n=1 Tax=Microbacterium natoriense TaxID=284570 RepID=A0AAW8EYI3_9MICO|nr:alpha/beta hydrolase [Microbacterium natoriense]MDQ0648308.1 pimeloyl-ACP methyl ester carboxylesterase [Microbacterium natoriense]